MCGIAGFVDFNKTSGLNELHKMTRVLQHRGPDGEGYATYQSTEASVPDLFLLTLKFLRQDLQQWKHPLFSFD